MNSYSVAVECRARTDGGRHHTDRRYVEERIVSAPNPGLAVAKARRAVEKEGHDVMRYDATHVLFLNKED